MREKGFTLIELMIVVAVIGIIVAIAVPQIQKYMNRDKATIEFQQPSSVGAAAPYTVKAVGPSPFKIVAKGMVDNQEVTVFMYEGRYFLITYSGAIVQY